MSHALSSFVLNTIDLVCVCVCPAGIKWDWSLVCKRLAPVYPFVAPCCWHTPAYCLEVWRTEGLVPWLPAVESVSCFFHGVLKNVLLGATQAIPKRLLLG